MSEERWVRSPKQVEMSCSEAEDHRKIWKYNDFQFLSIWNLGLTLMGVNKSPFALKKKSTTVTMTFILENYMTGVKLLLKKTQKNWMKQIKRMATELGFLTTCTHVQASLQDCWSIQTTVLLQWDGYMHLNNCYTRALLISWIVLSKKLGVYF